MTYALSLDHVCYTYHSLKQETPALHNVSFHIKSGEFVAVVGPSGCGKSTLLHLIARLLSLDSGEILINGYPLVISKEKVGYMLQNDQLLPWKTIYENAVLGLKIQKIRDPAAYERVEHLLTSYGLEDFRDSYPDQLSGGMRQGPLCDTAGHKQDSLRPAGSPQGRFFQCPGGQSTGRFFADRRGNHQRGQRPGAGGYGIYL